jgi:hypothetical protein
MQHKTTMGKAMSLSEDSNMPDIAALSKEFQRLGSSYEIWALWSQILIMATAVVALLYAGVSYKALRYANQKNKVQEVLDETTKRESDEKIADLNLQIAKANERASAANETAEREKLERLKLEARLAARTLTASPKEQLVNTLSQFSGVETDVVIFEGTPEVYEFANEIVGILEMAKWNVHAGAGTGVGMAIKGILVGIKKEEGTALVNNAAHAFIGSLIPMGIACGFDDFDKLQYPPILATSISRKAPLKIFIGSKPQP